MSPFRKSSYSAQSGDCVEVAHTTDGGRALRDSKSPARPHLSFGPSAWISFVKALIGDAETSA
ncbi:DUF397 domain-containing protein [Streptomyces albospinus]|uniref:DUF397 domain-containing protein n=1 Tax=Streptomyces albospinus TaxID=285515 RepID=UPI001E3C8CD4|nr:DUF397 domain-containing protein [Streptomyces albospinus]